jgi:FkbM family methyltransferase
MFGSLGPSPGQLLNASFLSRIGKLVRNASRRVGVDVVRYDPTRSVSFRRQQLLSNEAITLVLDVGANVGQYGTQLRADGYSGPIMSVEPLSDAFATLSDRAKLDHNWACIRSAIGDRDGEVSINISANSYSSSLLSMCAQHLASAPESAYSGTEVVPLQRLDSLTQDKISPSDRLYLKIDVQGFERQVLDGAPRTLRQVRAIEVELSLVTLYEGQTLFAPMIKLLQDAGFQLISVEPGLADRRSGQMLQLDGIFVRRP